MRVSLLVACIILCNVCSAQHTYQNANSIVVNPNLKTNEAWVEGSFEFNHFQLTGIYNISPKLFVHSNLKLNVLQQRADKFFDGFPGSKTVWLHNNDIGYGIGFGMQNIASVGRSNLQWVAGYDYEKQRYTYNEKLYNKDFTLTDSVSKQHNALYKISSNLNLVTIKEKYNINYLLRLSYCNFTKYTYNDVAAMLHKSGFVIAEPAVGIDFKLLKQHNLAITCQGGLSLPLSNFEYSYQTRLPSEDAVTETNDYLLDVILKLGVRYSFLKK